MLRSPWSARENLPRDLGYPVNQVNVDKGQGGHTSTRKLVRTTQSPEVECSQVRRQENALNSDSWKQGDQEESSNCTRTRRLVRAATPITEFHNMKYTSHQHMTKIFHFQPQKLGTAAGYSIFLMEASKTNVLIKKKCSCLRQRKQPFIFGPNYLANLAVYKNTNFEESQKLILEHFQEILKMHTIESASLSWTGSVLSHDPVVQWTKATARVYSASVLCLGNMNESKDAITRW